MGNYFIAGIDDGNAYTKIALSDGRRAVVPSHGVYGPVKRTQIGFSEADHPIQAFNTEDQDDVVSVGGVPYPSKTNYNDYQLSALNRVITHYALRQMGVGQTPGEEDQVEATFGLPVSLFYGADGTRRTDVIDQKRASYGKRVTPVDEGGGDLRIAKPRVVPEGLAGYFWYVIEPTADGKSAVTNRERAEQDLVIIDIGGRTTDFVVVEDGGVDHAKSGSVEIGGHILRDEMHARLAEQFNLDPMRSIKESRIREAIESGFFRTGGERHPVHQILAEERNHLASRIHEATQTRIGKALEYDSILVIGGGVNELRSSISEWFPRAVIPKNPGFVNAEGMLYYNLYVAED